MREDKIIYAISVEDVQQVAQMEMNRDLTDSELKIVEVNIGDQFDWFEAIASVIQTRIKKH